MSNLSKETLARIEKDAEVYGEEHQDHLYNVKGYSTYNDLVGAYNAGALHEAERAAGLVELIEYVINFPPAMSKSAMSEWVDEVRKWGGIALAKYKEVNA